MAERSSKYQVVLTAVIQNLQPKCYSQVLARMKLFRFCPRTSEVWRLTYIMPGGMFQRRHEYICGNDSRWALPASSVANADGPQPAVHRAARYVTPAARETPISFASSQAVLVVEAWNIKDTVIGET